MNSWRGPDVAEQRMHCGGYSRFTQLRRNQQTNPAQNEQHVGRSKTQSLQAEEIEALTPLSQLSSAFISFHQLSLQPGRRRTRKSNAAPRQATQLHHKEVKNSSRCWGDPQSITLSMDTIRRDFYAPRDADCLNRNTEHP